MIGIIDYGMGNLFSVSKALERLNVSYFISESKEELLKADALILPGVGSFKDAMNILTQSGLDAMIHQFVETGKPLLGICLGMQLLFEKSEENGITKGLSLLPGEVKRFSGVNHKGEAYKVPHMGWNQLSFTNRSSLFKTADEDHVYFVHSYYVDPKETDVILASSFYDVEVPAVVGRNQVYGMQFHPEKSGKLGMELLKKFTEIAGERVGMA
ncbi:imidazole glycerol phosphate synthase subunit HisH [Cytobacillus spongiae]|jgi:glutamine amidotransferase|uniref:imidazole glycerol phosphate synthase subunit HisH n=1 Tax=Cytobacillus spongiae TaxID=2901381 RepID=UPI001F458817|nr:imidazole glycerol phosphate synthase subunit HisH [Cytobacillus spongiae]UII55566.1 imidazole glycerol phosphate synthase subunit HisH [Cytobacillus spongiae]